MQIEAGQTICAACGSPRLAPFAVLHHMVCAYVGPEYDFARTEAGLNCPKCSRDILPNDAACEIVGTGARCNRCEKEMLVTPE